MARQLIPALRFTLILTVLTGLLYPGIVTGIAQVLFPRQSNGSLVQKDGMVVGSGLIGQNFTRPEYFHGRPSAAGEQGYDSSASGGSNLGPTSRKLADRVGAAVRQFRAENPGFTGPIPSDALTASASGLDPHISPATALAQVDRVAAARGRDVAVVEKLVERYTEGRDLGILGEPRVNVLELNIALDRSFPLPSSRNSQ